MDFKHILRDKNILYLSLIILLAFLYRVYFFMGHIFSDDAYYNFLAYTMYSGHFLQDYIGYPVMPLRIGVISITAFGFSIFGTNEIATTIFPMIISLLNIILTYKIITLISSSKKTALIGAAIMAFFSTDVIFASINFSDSPSAFFINLGIYFLWCSKLNGSFKFSIFSGIAFGLSIFFKINVIYPLFLLAILFFYNLIVNRKFDLYLVLPVITIFIIICIEGAVYYYINGDFLFRFHQTELNYQYCWNDFFMKGSQFGYATDSEYSLAVLDRIFLQNPKAIFLRRFNLFIPLLALIQAARLIRENKYKVLVFWFLGFSILLIGFTSSLSIYRPNVLRFNWYLYPLFLPAIALCAIFVSRLKRKFMVVFFVLYFASGLFMSRHYEEYFNKASNLAFKEFICNNPGKTIFTDHYVKYSLDLLDGFKNPSRISRISKEGFDWKKVAPGDWVVIDASRIKELSLQGHTFPDFAVLDSKRYELINRFSTFKIYEKR